MERLKDDSRVLVLNSKGNSGNVCWDKEDWRVRTVDQNSHLGFITFEMLIRHSRGNVRSADYVSSSQT